MSRFKGKRLNGISINGLQYISLASISLQNPQSLQSAMSFSAIEPNIVPEQAAVTAAEASLSKADIEIASL